MDGTADAAPQVRARTAGVFYLLTIVFGALALAVPSGGVASNLIATACYVAVVVLFYRIFEPVNKSLSLLAAFFGLVGCTVGALSAFDRAPFEHQPSRLLRMLLPPHRHSHSHVDVPASHPGRADGIRRPGLVDVRVTAAGQVPVPLQHGLPEFSGRPR